MQGNIDRTASKYIKSKDFNFLQWNQVRLGVLWADYKDLAHLYKIPHIPLHTLRQVSSKQQRVGKEVQT